MKLRILLLAIIPIHFLQATTIVAPKNLKELGEMSEVVVYATCSERYTTNINGVERFRFNFAVKHHLKGDISSQFVVQNLHLKMDSLERTVISDVDFNPGQAYLLFLEWGRDETWRAQMLSYGIYKEIEFNGKAIMAPLLENGHGVLNIDQVEELYFYEKTKLISNLDQALNQNAPWNGLFGRIEKPIEAQIRTAPSHCTFFTNSTYPKWNGFPSTNLPVRIASSGDPGCNQGANKIRDAINTMNSAYTGINIVYAGTHNYNPPNNCGDATSDNFITYVDNNYTSRIILIQFDDPCGEMSNLNNCNGVLAYGGIYWGSTFTENGETYRRALYGHVVTNDHFGDCFCNSNTYLNTMTHEMGHTLGFGHITSGPANMNPSNAGSITNLDIQCFDFLYPGGSSSNCPTQEIVDDMTIRSNMTFQATQQITMDNVTINNSATLTLIAPTIIISERTQISKNARLVTINENQCN